jgi:hypothetical protein
MPAPERLSDPVGLARVAALVAPAVGRLSATKRAATRDKVTAQESDDAKAIDPPTAA